MRKNKDLLAIMLAVAMVAGSVSVPGEQVNAKGKTKEYVVLAKNDAGYDKAEEVCEETETEVAEELEENYILVGEMTEKEAAELEQDKDIVIIEENIVLSACSSDKEKKEKDKDKSDKKNKSDKKKAKGDASSEQWNLSAVHLPENCEQKDRIKVAILDSGVSFDEDIDVSERFSIPKELEVENVMFDDTTGHGTGVAGVIAAKDNGMGIRGINPDAEICSIQILDENNQTTLSDLVAGIYKAVEQDCQIINMSLGTSVDSEVLHEAVRYAYDAGVLMVAAAGNTDGGAVAFPAAYEEVLAVGATNAKGNKEEATSDGKEIDIFAPGNQVLVTGLFGGIVSTEGTSVAAAQVSGAASLIWAKDKSKSAGFVRSLLVNTAQTVKKNGSSDAGLMDIENAIMHFDELEENYTESVCEYNEIQDENREREEFLDVKLVNGLWRGKTHDGMVSNAGNSCDVKDAYIKLMQLVARDADEKYSDVEYLHASYNYVQGLKFLYQSAAYLRSGKGIDSALTKAATDAKMDVSSGKGAALYNATRKMLRWNYMPDVTEGSNDGRFYKVMGFAMHLTGDIYAHRTMVPSYTIAGSNPKSYRESTSTTSADAKFGTSDFLAQGTKPLELEKTLIGWAEGKEKKPICKHWRCFQRTIYLGVMEFRDVRKYVTTEKGRKRYADNPGFCKERYIDGKEKCAEIFQYSMQGKDFKGNEMLRPTRKYVKLNNLKEFAEKVGENTSKLSDAEWSKISTLPQ